MNPIKVFDKSSYNHWLNWFPEFVFLKACASSYLSSFFQQQLNAICISHHASTVQWFQRPMHTVDICSLEEEEKQMKDTHHVLLIHQPLPLQHLYTISTCHLKAGAIRASLIYELKYTD